MTAIARALLSVSDKTGLIPFARGLHSAGIQLFSTGGTARSLDEAGLPVTPVEELTGFPEMMDGRVKTLHPAVHGGILAVRSDESHIEALSGHGFSPIDLVVVNLYPFARTVSRPGCSRSEAIENIDIGGPSMIRSAAKNHAWVTVVTDAADYLLVLKEIQEQQGEVSAATRSRLAAAAFAHTAAYDAAIAGYLQSQIEDAPPLPEKLLLAANRAATLRYGENPHQAAALYLDPVASGATAAAARQLHGKELSFINYLDTDAALELVREFEEPACAIVKHTNPCGCAIAGTLAEAYELARDGELPPRNSRFGGIIACNRQVDEETAALMIAPGGFYECIVAPGFSEAALELFRSRSGWGATVRLLETGPLEAAADAEAGGAASELDIKRISGGFLVQQRDRRIQTAEDLIYATDRRPTAAEQSDLRFAWRVVRHVKSNAIVLARGGQLVGSGPGQTSRVQSSAIAVEIAGERVKGAVCASDAFFPFADGPEALAAAGVTAIIQPGGSNRDAEVIEACNRHGVAMVFTGARHFRH